ncbi:unnamed protein product [Larinioides sclopetarius]|uniref:Uncharacterized protein n=1 Tax=Larinioides sclopetarius TaxID=280406 RepID=A0AAV2BL54_9ARAC
MICKAEGEGGGISAFSDDSSESLLISYSNISSEQLEVLISDSISGLSFNMVFNL